MAVKIGSARIDENGRAHGGQAGDQTGREVSTQSWYKHAKGWRVFRAKDPAVAEKIAQDMQWACDNSRIGYDQYQRDTLYNISKPLGFNCKQVTTACETDCSALVRVCVNYAGIPVGNFRTTDEASKLLATGAFVELTGSKYTDQSAYLGRGDILCTRTQGHTVVVLSNGSKFEGAVKPAATGRTVRIVGGNCYVRTAPNTDGKKLGVAYSGDALPYGGQTSGDGWHMVVYKGAKGWVSGKYSRVEA